MVVALAIFASCDKEEVITESKLPSYSKEFLETHFPAVGISHIIKETEGVGKTYTAYLTNGFDVDFTKKGDWNDVDGHLNEVPQSILDLLPSGISEYVNTHFRNPKIVQVNKERYGYKIGLNYDIDLEFNSKGEFLRID
jgi:hypothetical protein